MSRGEVSRGSLAHVGTPGAFSESSGCLADMDMPWGWILENLLDVKKLPLSFIEDIIGYVPHIEQPQCSRLLQKVALSYLDEVTVTRKLDTCDVLLLRFILKEQGVSNLRRIHSLKESFENDLTLRVETEVLSSEFRAALTILRCSSKEGKIDWAAFEDAVDSVLAEDIFEPYGIERRKELTAVLPDPSNGEPEKDRFKQLLEKYPLDDLCTDLMRFVDDKRKFFNIKFLDQLANDVENGAYSFSPGSDSPETCLPSKVRPDCRDSCQVQDDLHGSTTLPGSTPAPCQKDNRTATDKPGDSDPRSGLAGVNVSEPNDVRAEMSFRMAEVDKSAKGLSNEMRELENEITKFTGDVQNTAGIEFSTPDLTNQQISNLSAPICGNPVATQQNSIATCPAKRTEGDLEIDELVENQRENRRYVNCHRTESLKKCGDRNTSSQHTLAASVAGTSRISPEKVTKRHAVEVVDQHTGVAKKRKLVDDDNEELSEEQRNKSAASRENIGFRPLVENSFGQGPGHDRFSIENVNIAAMSVSESCKYDLPADQGGDGGLKAECYLCGNNGSYQAICHQCSVPVHESCLSELFINQVTVEDCWHCFACAATIALKGLRNAQEDMKEAIEALKKAEEEVLTTQERLATFFSARKEHSREHPTGQNAVGFNLCGKVTEVNNESIQSMNAEQCSTVDRRVEGRTISPMSGTITATRVKASVQNVSKDDSIRHICQTRQEIKMQTAPQASGLSEGLQAGRRYHGPDPDLPRGGISAQVSISLPSLPVLEGLAPEDNHVFGCGGKGQSGGPQSSPDRVLPRIPNAHDSDITSGPNHGLNENVGATNVATNGSGVSRSHDGDSGPTSDPLFNMRNPEGEEGDGHDGDLEEVCEGNLAAAERTNAPDQAVGVISERISEASNVGGKLRHGQVYRGRNQVPGIRRRHLPWTDIEEDVLKEGVNLFSNSGEWGFQWKRILDFGVGKFHESRTPVDLKDKWRNMLRGRSMSSTRSS